LTTKTKANILVVEDSLAAAKRLQISLEHAGFSVDIARNGREAWEKAKRRHFDLVITDEQMPVMTGRELCQHLRSDARYRRTPIVFLTAAKFGTEAAAVRDDLEITATFGKPFNPASLVHTVEAELSAARRAGRKIVAAVEHPSTSNAHTAHRAVAEPGIDDMPTNEPTCLSFTFLISPGTAVDA
jgi:DNA-binding response OmpR family regulator